MQIIFTFSLLLAFWHVRMHSLAQQWAPPTPDTGLTVKTMTQQQMTTERNALGLSLLASVASQPQTCHQTIRACFRGHRGTTHNIQGGNP
jgi:hypothetical protein